MASQSVCSSLFFHKTKSSNHRSSLERICSPPSGVICGRNQRFQSNYGRKSLSLGLKWVNNDFHLLRVNKVARVNASVSDLGDKLTQRTSAENVTGRGNDGFEPLRGKSGSVSFYGITHQMVEEGKLESAPFKRGTGSFLWLSAPLVLIMSLVLPPLLVGNAVNVMIKDAILAETVSSLSMEAAFYAGLAAFLAITDRVQRPYLQYSAKRWSLITGLKGYLSSAFFTMGLKVIAPLFAVYVTWPELGMEGLVAVAPFLLGCFAQFIFEISLKFRGSSCWPLVPIIFEGYRIYQLTKACHFVERLLYAMAGQASTAQLVERSNALVGMVVTFQALGLVCLWSLLTFLLRLHPSRPVADNY
ncbi:hypothetical protein V2J09_011736 [Rumex salicifolius]